MKYAFIMICCLFLFGCQNMSDDPEPDARGFLDARGLIDATPTDAAPTQPPPCPGPSSPPLDLPITCPGCVIKSFTAANGRGLEDEWGTVDDGSRFPFRSDQQLRLIRPIPAGSSILEIAIYARAGLDAELSFTARRYDVATGEADSLGATIDAGVGWQILRVRGEWFFNAGQWLVVIVTNEAGPPDVCVRGGYVTIQPGN